MLLNKDLTIVANWKMHPNSYIQAKNLIDSYIQHLNFNNINLLNLNLIIAPPAIYLQSLITDTLKNNINISFSAQNISCATSAIGAYTGEVSASMFKDLGCKYAIIGHSECRKHDQETDQLIAKKFLIALQAALIPIVCIGEDKTQFEQGNSVIKLVLAKQLKLILQQANNFFVNTKNIEFFIAYEPIWSIGTGLYADLSHINQIAAYIREQINNSKLNSNIKIKILYGGSVNITNAKNILESSNIDGALIGGSSLDGPGFAKICQL